MPLGHLALAVRVAIVLGIGQYGPTVLTIAEDAAGNVITYRGATELGCTGDRLTLSATVAEHTEWQGVKQTRISRPKVTSEELVPDGRRVVARSALGPRLETGPGYRVVVG